MSDRPLVTNAANEGQLEKAKLKVKVAEDRVELAYRAVLASEDGQLVMWDLLQFCGTFRSIWESSAKIHYNSGRQDVGHYLQAKVAEVNPDALMQMMLRAYSK